MMWTRWYIARDHIKYHVVLMERPNVQFVYDITKSKPTYLQQVQIGDLFRLHQPELSI